MSSDQTLQLAWHGTSAYRLTPGAILSAAQSDLAARAVNKRLSDKYGSNEAIGDFKPYAFLARHVRRAQSPAHLILLALGTPELAIKRTTKVNAVRLYRDADALFGALLLADEIETARLAQPHGAVTDTASVPATGLPADPA
jgi:hypothetical protein